jgi:hypothetical protein
MKPIRTLLVVATVALATAAAATPMAPPRLTGTVGPGFTISLKRGTTLVKTLKAGRYTFAVSDKSGIHNFTIRGPGNTRGPIRVITTTSFAGTKTVTLTLRRGKYRYYCSVHASQMFGLFSVT